MNHKVSFIQKIKAYIELFKLSRRFSCCINTQYQMLLVDNKTKKAYPFGVSGSKGTEGDILFCIDFKKSNPLDLRDGDYVFVKEASL